MDVKTGFGIHYPTEAMFDYEKVSQAAATAEDLGYDYFCIGDHLFSSKKRYEQIGWDPRKPTKLDAWSTLLMLALKTNRIKIGSCVSPIIHYLPFRLARMAASVDILSEGRLILGLGAGRGKEETEAYGINWEPFSSRVERLQEGLQIILRLWLEERASFTGRYYSINNAPLFPKPVQKPHPPIWVGGMSERILRSAAEQGNGWVFANYGKWTNIPLVENFKARLEKIKRYAEEKGRNISEFNFVCILIYPSPKRSDEWIREVDEFVSSGANSILIKPIFMKPARVSEEIKSIAKDVIPSFR